jgi:HK97 family phage major capsid protein
MALYTAAGGGPILSPEQVQSLVIQPLIDQSVAAQVSTVVSTSSHDLRVPIVTADPAAAWTAEGAEIAVTDPTLTEVTVTPKKLAGLVVVSNELANDSSPAALQVVGDGLVRDLRRKIDAAYFGNTVTNGPSGLGSLTTSTAGNAGAWANLDSFEAAKSAAETLHTTITAFVTSPATALTLGTLKEYGTTGSNKPLLQSDPTQPAARTISGVPLYVSPAVGADVVWAIPRQHSLFVIRQDASVVTDSSVFFTSDRVAVRATLRVSFGFTYPLSVVKITKAA